MDETLISLLESFGYPVYRQGSMEKEATYPPTFFTFWNAESDDHAFYDNKEYGVNWEFDVNVYSSDPATTYTLLEQARTLLKNNGWLIPGKGHDLASDEPSHTGRGMLCIITEFNNSEED